MKKITAPVVRFKGFTGPWKQRKLSDIVTEVTRTDETSEAPVMMITAENGFIKQSDRYTYNNSGKSIKKYIVLKRGELAYNHGASKLRPYGSCFPLITEKEARIPFVYHCFRADHNNSQFLSFILNGESVERQLKKLVSSGARMDGLLNISFEEYGSVLLDMPSKNEEDKITDSLIKLDNLITLHQRKLEQQKKLKKYFLQNMFPEQGETAPRIRFKGFTGDWEQLMLGEISSVIDPHPSHRAPAETEAGIPFIGIGDVDEAGNINYSTARIVDEKIYDEHHKRYDLAIPSVGIGRVASLGKVIRLRNDIGKYAVSPTMSIIQFSQEVDVNYMYSCMSSPYFQQQFTAQSSGSTRQSVGIQDLRRFMIPIPQNKIEQINIGMFFWKLDSIIILQQRKLDQLQNVKKFMLQNLFI